MTIAINESGHLLLPKRLAKRLQGRKVEIIETEEGILIRPVTDPIKKARGILKGYHFNSTKFSKQKRLDKSLDH